MRFLTFPLHLSQVPRLPWKSETRSCEVLRPSRKITLANLKIWFSKMQRFSGNQCPDPPNMSDGYVSCTAPAMRNASLQIPLQMSHACHGFWTRCKAHALTFWQSTESSAPATKNDAGASKSGPNVVCFYHFDFESRFTPQRRAILQYFSTSQFPEVLWGWWFLHVHLNLLRATAACNFWFLIRADGSAPAALASLLFDPLEPQTLGKNRISRLFYIFAHPYLLASDLLSADLLSTGSFSSLPALTTVAASVHKSEVWLLNFLRLYMTYWHAGRRVPRNSPWKWNWSKYCNRS